MQTSWLDRQDAWVIVAILLVVMTLTAELAYQFGHRIKMKATDSGKGHFGSVLGSLLGLISLLLSFTFGMSTQRYEARRMLMIEDAGAISAFYMRSYLLPDEQRLQIKSLLRQYVDLRPRAVPLVDNQQEFESLEDQSRALLTKMFDMSRQMAQAQPPIKGSDEVVKAYIDVLASHARRLSALSNRVPDSIIIMLLGAATIGMFAIGYSAGLGSHRGIPARVLLPILICGAIYVVIDLDRPHSGLISIDQGPILRLQQVIDADPETRGATP